MNKMQLLRLLSGAGDSFVLMRDKTESLCTVDFSTKYIKKYRKKYRTSLNFKDKTTILVFNWSENKFAYINPKDVTHVTPLANILKNTRDKSNG